ncbi:MAG: hypothetical protein ACE5J5_01025 [Candidatus Hydrothermarchaeales archaeon]
MPAPPVVVVYLAATASVMTSALASSAVKPVASGFAVPVTTLALATPLDTSIVELKVAAEAIPTVAPKNRALAAITPIFFKFTMCLYLLNLFFRTIFCSKSRAPPYIYLSVFALFLNTFFWSQNAHIFMHAKWLDFIKIENHRISILFIIVFEEYNNGIFYLFISFPPDK